jgi:hypothetical protein
MIHREDLVLAIDEYCKATGLNEVIVVGSMSILASFEPEAPYVSRDIDMYPVREDTPGQFTLLIADQFGPGSDFQEIHKFTIESVGDWTTMFSAPGWQDRLVPVETPNGNVGRCLDPLDLAFNKVEAGRDKDLIHLAYMLRANYVDEGELRHLLEVGSRHEENLVRNLETLEKAKALIPELGAELIDHQQPRRDELQQKQRVSPLEQIKEEARIDTERKIKGREFGR